MITEKSHSADKESSERACKILIVKLSSLGDLFHALPAAATLKDRLGAEIHWCVQEEYVDLVRCFDDVTRIIPFPRRCFLKKRKEFRTELRKERYDFVIDMQGLMKSCLVTLMSNGDRKIGPSFSREGTALLYPEKAVGKVKGRHAVERIMDVLRHLKVAPMDIQFRVTFPDVEVEGGHPRIALVPASRWLTKTWSARAFADTAKRMLKTGPMSFYMIGGPADVELCEAIASDIGSCAKNLAGRFSIPESGGVLQKMDLVISNDSGPMHIAAAAGRRVLAVFGPTDPSSTGPYGKNHQVLTSDLSCRPCFSRRCSKDGIPCLSGVTAERAAEAALQMLSLR